MKSACGKTVAFCPLLPNHEEALSGTQSFALMKFEHTHTLSQNMIATTGLDILAPRFENKLLHWFCLHFQTSNFIIMFLFQIKLGSTISKKMQHAHQCLGGFGLLDLHSFAHGCCLKFASTTHPKKGFGLETFTVAASNCDALEYPKNATHTNALDWLDFFETFTGAASNCDALEYQKNATHTNALDWLDFFEPFIVLTMDAASNWGSSRIPKNSQKNCNTHTNALDFMTFIGFTVLVADPASNWDRLNRRSKKNSTHTHTLTPWRRWTSWPSLPS